MTQLYDFKKLLKDFLDKKTTAKDFETIYLKEYLENKIPISEDLFYCLDELFYWVDAYTDLPIEEDENPEDYATEEQLRDAAKIALDEFVLLENENKLLEK